MELFFTVSNQMVFLFLIIIIGYILAEFKFIPYETCTILSKLENILFIPALIMSTFIKNFTPDSISIYGNLLMISSIMVLILIPISILISLLCTKNSYKQRIYTYGLIFSNFAFMGNAIVSAIFPDIFFEYLIFVLPLWIMIYLWGVPALLLADSDKKLSLKDRLKSFLNPMFIAMLIGMIIGLTGINVPKWMNSTAESLGNCMSPIAMLLTGITVSSIDIKETFKKVQIYIITFVKLIVFPLGFIILAKFIPFSDTVRISTLCWLAMPFGLNTIVIPSAYGKDTSTASGMAIVSHLLSCITIPLILALT